MFKPGDPVKHVGPNGSYGKILRYYTPPSTYDVTWNYGKDVKGEAITSISLGLGEGVLEPISPEQYDSYTACEAWTPEQVAIRNGKRTMTNSIIHEWAANLGLRHQGVLVSAIRGCDSVEREDPSKYLVRMYRGILLRAHVGDIKKAASFMTPFDQEIWDHTTADFLRSIDHYPNHWLLHWMHACEIVGYKYQTFPQNTDIGDSFLALYLKLVRKFHLNPETEEEMDRRLNAAEADFKKAQV